MCSILKSIMARPGRVARLRCSFCGRGADAVERLVAGASAHICDSCITDCAAVLQENGGFTPPGRQQPTH